MADPALFLMTSEFLLFGTEGCHLCEKAAMLLTSSTPPVDFQSKDIIDNDAWTTLYAIRIPVLHHLPSGRELGWPFDQHQLNVFLQDITLAQSF